MQSGHAILLVNPDGGLTQLRLRYRSITSVDWSRDERWFVYTAIGPGGYAVVAQPIDGSPPVELTPWGGDVEWADHYAWRPTP